MAYPNDNEFIEIKILVKDDFVLDYHKLQALKKGISFSEYFQRLLVKDYNAQNGGQNV